MLLENLAVYEIMWKNLYSRADDNVAHARYMLAT